MSLEKPISSTAANSYFANFWLIKTKMNAKRRSMWGEIDKIIIDFLKFLPGPVTTMHSKLQYWKHFERSHYIIILLNKQQLINLLAIYKISSIKWHSHAHTHVHVRGQQRKKVWRTHENWFIENAESTKSDHHWFPVDTLWLWH